MKPPPLLPLVILFVLVASLALACTPLIKHRVLYTLSIPYWCIPLRVSKWLAYTKETVQVYTLKVILGANDFGLLQSSDISLVDPWSLSPMSFSLSIV